MRRTMRTGIAEKRPCCKVENRKALHTRKRLLPKGGKLVVRYLSQVHHWKNDEYEILLYQSYPSSPMENFMAFHHDDKNPVGPGGGKSPFIQLNMKKKLWLMNGGAIGRRGALTKPGGPCRCSPYVVPAFEGMSPDPQPAGNHALQSDALRLNGERKCWEIGMSAVELDLAGPSEPLALTVSGRVLYTEGNPSPCP